MSDTVVRVRTPAICLGARVRHKKTGQLGTVQFETELVPRTDSTGARLGMYPIVAIEVETDAGEILWPLTAEDVEVLPCP